MTSEEATIAQQELPPCERNAKRRAVGEMLAYGYSRSAVARALGTSVRSVGRLAPSQWMIRQIREQLNEKRKAELLREETRQREEMERQRDEAARVRRRARATLQQVCERCGQLGILPCAACSPEQ